MGFAKYRSALDRVLQLPDISGPRLTLQECSRIRTQRFQFAAMPCSKLLTLFKIARDKMIGYHGSLGKSDAEIALLLDIGLDSVVAARTASKSKAVKAKRVPLCLIDPDTDGLKGALESIIASPKRKKETNDFAHAA